MQGCRSPLTDETQRGHGSAECVAAGVLQFAVRRHITTLAGDEPEHHDLKGLPAAVGHFPPHIRKGQQVLFQIAQRESLGAKLWELRSDRAGEAKGYAVQVVK